MRKKTKKKDKKTALEKAASLLAIPENRTMQGMSFGDREAGISQMLADLKQLATDDGCVAAAWAYEWFLDWAEKQEGRCCCLECGCSASLLSGETKICSMCALDCLDV